MERAGVYRDVEAAGFKVTKIDVDKNREAANLYRISAMPTFVVLKDGSEQSRSIGARSADQLLAELAGR
jgi:thioredoxin-like negative regulator of GroEL